MRYADLLEISRELMKERTVELRDISIFIHNIISQDLVALSFMVHDPDPTAQKLIDRTRLRETIAAGSTRL